MRRQKYASRSLDHIIAIMQTPMPAPEYSEASVDCEIIYHAAPPDIQRTKQARTKGQSMNARRWRQVGL